MDRGIASIEAGPHQKNIKKKRPANFTIHSDAGYLFLYIFFFLFSFSRV